MRRLIVRIAGVTLLACAAGLISIPASAQDWLSPEKRCPSPYGAATTSGAPPTCRHPRASRVAAAKLIHAGKMYELGKILDRNIPMSPGRSFVLSIQRTSGPNGRNQQGGNEETVFTEPRPAGYPVRRARPPAARRAASLQLRRGREGRAAQRVHQVRRRRRRPASFFVRGVLLDIAALKGVDMLPDDYMITRSRTSKPR